MEGSEVTVEVKPDQTGRMATLDEEIKGQTGGLCRHPCAPVAEAEEEPHASGP